MTMVEPSRRLALNSETVRFLVSPSGDDFVRALHRKRYQRTLLGISQIQKRLLNEAGELFENTGFAEAFELLRRYPAQAQEQVLSYPSVAFWVDVAEDLLRREAHVRFPETHFATHLESFWRVVLAVSSITSSGEIACHTRTDGAARLCLPGTGSYLQLPRGCEYQRIKVVSSGGAIQSFVGDEGDRVPIEARESKIPKIADIELNSLDVDLRLPDRSSFEYQDLTESDVIKWESPIHQSLRWIATCSPLLSKEVRQALRCIVPVRSPGTNTHTSATFLEAPGLMALSWTPDAAMMVEAMVHEYHHTKLNSLLVLDRLILGPTEEAVFYSPWRTDPRPLLGILHGAFVFQAILEFWHRFFEAGIPLLQEERTRQRMYLIQAQTRQAITTIEREAALSDLGAALLEAMKVSVSRFDVTLRHESKAIQRRIDQVQEEHRARWEAANGAGLQ